jgi:hypothetical protein
MRLDADFEDQLREAALRNGRDALMEAAWDAIEASEERLQAWASERDWDNVQSILDSRVGPFLEREADFLRVKWRYDHPAALYFETGTSDHVVEGDPLSFVWDTEDAPRWVKKEFEREGKGYRVFLARVEVSGLPETRFTRRGVAIGRETLQRMRD